MHLTIASGCPLIVEKSFDTYMPVNSFRFIVSHPFDFRFSNLTDHNGWPQVTDTVTKPLPSNLQACSSASVQVHSRLVI